MLVTNDFPPKVGGIQSYLWELWRRLPSDQFGVFTPDHPMAAGFDQSQPFLVSRSSRSVLLPTPFLAREIRRRADILGAGLIVLDPALPLGLVGADLGRPYVALVHGAEITVPGHLPGSRQLLRRVLLGAVAVIASGTFPAAESESIAGRPLPAHVIPPGVDCQRFRPISRPERREARARFGLPANARVVLTMSRLVPRKGMDIVIAACSLLAETRRDLVLVVAGEGRDRQRLERLAREAPLPVRFTGAVSARDLPVLMACSDVFAMLCRNRWAGLEQEGFGIVFLEAAACGVPQVAGASGGAADAVVDGETGLVVRHPEDPVEAAQALALLLDDNEFRDRLGRAARHRAENDFCNDRLAVKLYSILESVVR